MEWQKHASPWIRCGMFQGPDWRIVVLFCKRGACLHIWECQIWCRFDVSLLVSCKSRRRRSPQRPRTSPLRRHHLHSKQLACVPSLGASEITLQDRKDEGYVCDPDVPQDRDRATSQVLRLRIHMLAGPRSAKRHVDMWQAEQEFWHSQLRLAQALMAWLA